MEAFYKTKRTELTGTPLRVSYERGATTAAGMHAKVWAAMGQYLSPLAQEEGRFSAGNLPYVLTTYNR